MTKEQIKRAIANVIAEREEIFDELDAIGIHEAERQLEIDAGLALDVDDLAETQHDRLLARVDHENRRIEQEQQDGDGDDDRGKTICHYWLPPEVFGCRAGKGR